MSAEEVHEINHNDDDDNDDGNDHDVPIVFAEAVIITDEQAQQQQQQQDGEGIVVVVDASNDHPLRTGTDPDAEGNQDSNERNFVDGHDDPQHEQVLAVVETEASANPVEDVISNDRVASTVIPAPLGSDGNEHDNDEVRHAVMSSMINADRRDANGSDSVGDQEEARHHQHPIVMVNIDEEQMAIDPAISLEETARALKRRNRRALQTKIMLCFGGFIIVVVILISYVGDFDSEPGGSWTLAPTISPYPTSFFTEFPTTSPLEYTYVFEEGSNPFLPQIEDGNTVKHCDVVSEQNCELLCQRDSKAFLFIFNRFSSSFECMLHDCICYRNVPECNAQYPDLAVGPLLLRSQKPIEDNPICSSEG